MNETRLERQSQSKNTSEGLDAFASEDECEQSSHAAEHGAQGNQRGEYHVQFEAWSQLKSIDQFEPMVGSARD